jgi:hypothetical protein
MLLRATEWLREPDERDRYAIGKAIERMLEDAAHE